MAVLVLSIGLLGIALMQTRALAGNNSTSSRSIAVVASYSILESMRADKANALAGNYDANLTGDTCNGGSTTFAQKQLTAWCNDLATKLGNTTSTIAVTDCDSTGICTVTITFDDSHVGTAAQGVPQTTSVVTKAGL